MVKYRLLTGIAGNIADSFASSTNHNFLVQFSHYPLSKLTLKLDLLNSKNLSEIKDVNEIEDCIKRYNKFLLKELNKMGIDLSEIKSCILTSSINLMADADVYRTSVILSLNNGKEYKASRFSSWFNNRASKIKL